MLRLQLFLAKDSLRKIQHRNLISQLRNPDRVCCFAPVFGELSFSSTSPSPLLSDCAPPPSLPPSIPRLPADLAPSIGEREL